MSIHFPDDFLWGASTAPHQNEGNNTNSDFWALEQLEPTIFHDRSGRALDFYHRWRADIDLLKSLGLNAFRFGIEWARIEPEPGEYSAAELAHYREIIDYCLARGIEPIITLHHFSSPLWFAQAGGWASEDAVERFGSYVDAVTPILEGVTWVATINEPNVFAVMQQLSMPLQFPDPSVVMAQFLQAGAAAAPDTDAGLNAFSMPAPEHAPSQTLIRAHEHARDILRKKTSVKVGWTIAIQGLVARDGHEDELHKYRNIWEDQFLTPSRDDDWVGVQSYTSQLVGPTGLEGAPAGAELTQTNWAYRPDALGMAVRRAWEFTGGVPILVTENGIATDDDQRRIDYTTGALQGLRSAISDGVDVHAYLHWTFIDNYEWVDGYTITFGLVAVDRDTLERTPKSSASWLGDIARTNGRDLAPGKD